MELKPPDGSKINVTTTGEGRLIVLPYAPGGASRYFAVLFILCWLGGWAFGLVSAVNMLVSGKGGGFLVFWLGAWIVGGGFAVYYVYRLVRPSVPESLLLTLRGVRYDSGLAPVQLQFQNGYYARDRWEAAKSFFAKRTTVDIDARQIQTLRLRDTDTGNRLTVDAGAERLDIARAATEIEREWLYQLLSERYGVPKPAA